MLTLLVVKRANKWASSTIAFLELLYASFKLVQRMALPDDGEEELDSLVVKTLPVVGRDEEKE